MQQPLLALSIPDSSYVVPLRDWSAACLLDVVASEGIAEKQRLLHQVLSTDPALLLWSSVGRDDIRAWRDVTVNSLTEWLLQDLDGLLIRDRSKLEFQPELADRLFDAQLSTISAARAAIAKLDASQSAISSIVYTASILARAKDWLFHANGSSISDELDEALPSWMRLLVGETKGPAEPSIGFMKLVRGTLLNPLSHTCEGGYIYDAERQLWSNDIPIMRSIFVKTMHRIQRSRPVRASEFDRIESAKLAAMKELAYGASHEINNPLTNIATRAQLLLRDELDSDRRRQLNTINRQAYRAHEMISDLMLFAKPPRLAKSRISVRPFLEKLTTSIADDPDLGLATITVSGTDEIEIAVDSAQLDTALRAIVKNSIEACGSPCTIAIDYSVRDCCFEPHANQSGTYLEIEVRDNGPGIPAEVRKHLFDPFYSGREAGRGLGFGLSKAWRIIEQHQGQIAVSTNGHGTSMVISLPFADQ